MVLIIKLVVKVWTKTCVVLSQNTKVGQLFDIDVASKFTWNCTEWCNSLSQYSDRKYIPIPNCCHGDYCPPKRTRNGSEHAIWLILFCIITQGRKQQDSHWKEKTFHQGAERDFQVLWNNLRIHYFVAMLAGGPS